MKPALERAARALCRHEGHPENIQFEGRPMWESYMAVYVPKWNTGGRGC